jgi:hypothetical protein
MNIKKLRGALTAGIAMLMIAPASWGALAQYQQNFDGLNIAFPDALGTLVGGDGWQIFGAVFDGDPLVPPNGTFAFGYGPFSAPNGGPGFSAIAVGEGQGSATTDQYMNIYSDYNCCGTDAGHFDAFSPFSRVQSSVFQEQIIGFDDIGSTWAFLFDAKQPGDVNFACSNGPNSECRAFIKTLDPNAGFATTNFITLDSRPLSLTDWSSHALHIDLSDAALEGQILQFGFESVAQQFEDTGVYYDNLQFQIVPVPAAVWLFGSALGLLAAMRRRFTS